MNKGVFTNKNLKPMIGDILGVLGKKRVLWHKMEVFLSKNYAAQGEWKFYGKRRGWAIRYKKDGRVLFSLYPQRKHFVAQIVLNESHVKKALKLNISDDIKHAIRNARQYFRGRRVYIKIVKNKHLRDLQILMLIKTELIKK